MTMPCPKCNAPRQASHIRCVQCGLVFHKYEAQQRRLAQSHSPGESVPDSGVKARIRETARQLLVPAPVMEQWWMAYAVLWSVFVVWGFGYLLADIDELGRGNFMHNVNLPFHEAGHVIFGVLGSFIGSLGGTLGQLLMPIIAGIALLKSRADTFGASLCLWWFGENFLDIAPYMADARAGVLPLLGGNYGQSSPYGFHDWEYLLGETGLLAYDTALAAATMNTGRLIMVLSMVWGGYLVWLAWRRR